MTRWPLGRTIIITFKGAKWAFWIVPVVLAGVGVYVVVGTLRAVEEAYAPNVLGEFEVMMSKGEAVSTRVERELHPETVLEFHLPPEVRDEEDVRAFWEGVMVDAGFVGKAGKAESYRLTLAGDARTTEPGVRRGRIWTDRAHARRHFARWRFSRDYPRLPKYLSEVRFRLSEESREVTAPLVLRVVGYYNTTGW